MTAQRTHKYGVSQGARMQQRIKKNVQHVAFPQACSITLLPLRWDSFRPADDSLQGRLSYQLLLLIPHGDHSRERDASSPY